MPSVSPEQRRLFAAALACKRGEGECTGHAKEIAASMSERRIKEFTTLTARGKGYRTRRRRET